MADLTPTAPAAGLLPLRHGGMTLTEVAMGPIHAVMPLNGADFRLPDPNCWEDWGEARAYWSGRGQAMIAGPMPEAAGCAVVAQSDAWCRVRLAGPGAEEVLARLIPVDPAALGERASIRTTIGHMQGLVARTPEGLEMWAFRSMAGTLVHDVGRAMRQVAARRALG